MNILKIPYKRSLFFSLFLFFIGLSALILILHLFLPDLFTSRYYQRSLNQLRHKARSIKNEFSQVIQETRGKLKYLPESAFPEEKENVFAFFKQLPLNSETEGIAYYDSKGNLILWHGNVIDLENFFQNKNKEILFKDHASYLIHNKASYYLIASQIVNEDDYIILYHLVAFLPQFKAHYLREYHFLKPKLLKNCSIDYWDFREDVSGFEKIFAKNRDEYIGQPRLQGEIQTIFFPLRNEKNRIIATVALRSPSLSAKLSAQKEAILLVFYLFLGISLIFLLIHFLKSPPFYKEKSRLTGLLVILTLLGLRMLFFPLSKLEKIQNLSIFSPSSASFLSFWKLTKSPADIFLTSFFLFLIAGCLIFFSRDIFKKDIKKCAFVPGLAINLFFISISIGLIFIFQELLFRLVFHSNLNLIGFSLKPSFILLHLSILLFFFIFALTSLWGLRAGSLHSTGLLLSFLILFLEFGGYFLLFRKKNHPFLFLFQVAIIILILLIANFPKIMRKKEFFFFMLLVSSLFIYSSLQYAAAQKNRSLLQNSLKNIIKSQEHWGHFLINQSLPEIEKMNKPIISFFRHYEPSDLAHLLWEKTLIAKFNWYSSLEMIAPEGSVLSRFSLNVPEPYRLDFDLPVSKKWIILHPDIPFMGKGKDFLVGYKDWYEGKEHLGRIILYISIDYDMLPILYSANPYYELLRVTSIPSLHQLNLGFAIFDLDGKLLFNPDKISSGIPENLLDQISLTEDSVWSSFIDKKKNYNSFYFRDKNRIYSLFLPKKNFLNYSVEFLRLFFLYLSFFLLSLLFFHIVMGRNKIKNPFWSFSNRVYLSFVIIAIIPLLLFTYSTRNFLTKIFSQQFTEKAEIHADFARRVMDDFIFLQQEDQVSLTLPPDNVVLWISSTISNDVNLYQDGKLISSSRREFFDYGFHPELIDGEIFYKIQYENNPYYTQTQKIGDYSFHTLTIPYFLRDTLLLLSIPFPLEQEEISKATAEMIEFLLFISFFFIAVVLLLARGIGGMIITPIQELLAGTKEVSLGNLEVSITHEHEDEMKTLIDGFNAMVKNLKKHQQELADISKKVAWAEMARKVAHEIKNPLTPIQLSAEHLLRVYGDKKENFDMTLKESVSYIIKEVENLRKIAHEFLETAKEASLQMETVDLREIIQETIEPYKHILSERIPIEETYRGNEFTLSGDKTKIKIALRNIITNAIEAIREHGGIKIELSKDKTVLYLKIIDTGIGMRNDVLERIFEPYFSTKEMGTGLGLSIAKKIIEDHGGSIQAFSKEKQGTTMTIRFPKSSQ